MGGGPTSRTGVPPPSGPGSVEGDRTRDLTPRVPLPTLSVCQVGVGESGLDNLRCRAERSLTQSRPPDTGESVPTEINTGYFITY